MLKKVKGFLAGVPLKRCRRHTRDFGLSDRDLVFSTFSLAYSLGLLAVGAGIVWLFLRSEAVVPPLILRWIDLFQIREIFAVELIDEALIRRAYRLLVLLGLAYVLVRVLLQLLRAAFGLMVLSADRLIVIESYLVRSRVHHIPYSRMIRMSVNETLLHRLFRLGNIEIVTGEGPLPLKFGPIPRFPVFISRFTSRIRGA